MVKREEERDFKEGKEREEKREKNNTFLIQLRKKREEICEGESNLVA